MQSGTNFHDGKEESLFYSFFEGNQAIKLLIDPDRGTIEEANLAACDFYGYTADEMSSMKYSFLNAVREEDDDFNQLRLFKIGAVQNVSCFHRLANEEVCNVSVNGGPLFFRGKEYLLLIIYDITGKTRAETVSQISRKQLLTVLNSMDALIYVAGLSSSTIIFANRYMRETFGEDITGRCCWDVIHGYKTGPCSFCRNAKLFENGNTGTARRWEYRSGRNGRWYQSIDRAITWLDGRIVRISIAVDISERKKLEQDIISISEKERISIGHDLHDGIGQYFTGLGFLARILKDKLSAADLPEKSVAEEILSLIEEGKKHTRNLARGLSPVNMDSLGIYAAVRELCMDTEKIFGVECKFSSDPDFTVKDTFTATHLYYIIREAVNNAMRHGEAKHVDIMMKKTDKGITAVIKDDGSGFDPDNAERGLGLNLMQYRADVIGGSVEISSSPGKGTEISCFLKDPCRTAESSNV